MKRTRGLLSLVFDAVDKTLDLVEVGHESTARTVMRVTDKIPGVDKPARLVNELRWLSTTGVLGAIRLGTKAVRGASDALLELAVARAESKDTPVVLRSDAMLGETRTLWAGDATLALLNAAIGDHLDAGNNGLSIAPVLRVGDRYFDATAPIEVTSSRVALYVHGLATTEWSWCLEGLAYHGDAASSFPTLLERDKGIPPIYFRYNTGRHVSTNGKALAALLERVAEGSPKLEELILVGHSMGGLVLRSACHYGTEAGHAWVKKVKRVICLGSPHRGAPLEKLGNMLTGVLGAIDLPGTLITARILEGRSAGIKDLRHGALVDEDWLGKDPDALVETARAEVPLMPGVTYHFVSATFTQDPAHPLGQLMGDLLVRDGTIGVTSAGPRSDTQFAIETAQFGGVLHHQLQNHPSIYAVVRDACE